MSRPSLSPARLAMLVIAVAGAVALVAAEFAPLLEVRTLQAVVRTVETGPHHAYAQLLIAIAAVIFAWGAARGGSRPALLGLAGLAVVSLLISLAHDLPDTSKAGNLADRFEAAKASPRTGMYLESLGGVLLLLSAATGLVFGEIEPAAPRHRPPADEPANGEPTGPAGAAGGPA